MQSTCDCSDDLGAYALGALSADEARRLGGHLDGCTECGEELRRLLEAVEVLPLSAIQYEPPRRLRRDLMAAVKADAAGAVHATAPRRAAPRLGWLATRPAFAGAAALACAVIAAIIVLAVNGGSSSHVYRAQVTVPGASAALHVGSGHRELVVAKLPDPGSGKIYEVWIQRPGHAPAATEMLFGVTRGGAAPVAGPNLKGASAVRVTAEPDGGSTSPTSKPVITATI